LVLQQVLVHFGNEKKIYQPSDHNILYAKINPSVSLNYRKNKVNVFSRIIYILKRLTKNEFVTRYYDNGDVINSKRNRNNLFYNIKSGFDYAINDQNSLTISGLLK
jgi:hypothetical protein